MRAFPPRRFFIIYFNPYQGPLVQRGLRRSRWRIAFIYFNPFVVLCPPPSFTQGRLFISLLLYISILIKAPLCKGGSDVVGGGLQYIKINHLPTIKNKKPFPSVGKGLIYNFYSFIKLLKNLQCVYVYKA